MSSNIQTGTITVGGGSFNGGVWTTAIPAATVGYASAELVGTATTQILYRVFVVDTDGDILDESTIVAKNPEDAKFKSGVYDLLRELEYDLDDVTVICQFIGSVKVIK